MNHRSAGAPAALLALAVFGLLSVDRLARAAPALRPSPARGPTTQPAAAAQSTTRPAPATEPASRPAAATRPASRPTGDKERKPAAATQPAGHPDFPPGERDSEIFGGQSERDSEIFGGEGAGEHQPSVAPGAASRPARPPADGGASRLEQRLLSLGTDRLQIGGMLYLRFNVGLTDGDELGDHSISMPNLVDVYLDARPNERLRGFVRGRVNYNPTVNEDDPLVKQAGTKQVSVVLNELWLKLDIYRYVYVTIGQQRVLWGTTRLWNPVDVINATRRPVLSPFDARNGVPMVKLHLPIERLGWNVYVVGLMDRVSSFDKAGVAGRAEFVFSTLEVALTGAYRAGLAPDHRHNLDPRVGLDLSAGIWNFDLSAELGLFFDDRFSHHLGVQSSAGLQYTVGVFDNDMLILGGEYFYNQLGSDHPNPIDLFTGKAQFFYAGRHYGSLFVALPSPAKLDDWSFTLSAVSNLSDLSYVLRFDLTVTVLTYLTVQAFIVGHLGKAGELRLGDGAFPADQRAVARQLFNPDQPNRPIPTQLIDLGLWLRLDL